MVLWNLRILLCKILTNWVQDFRALGGSPPAMTASKDKTHSVKCKEFCRDACFMSSTQVAEYGFSCSRFWVIRSPAYLKLQTSSLNLGLSLGS